MPIQYIPGQKNFVLHSGENTCAIKINSENVPVNLWYGLRIGHPEKLPSLSALTERIRRGGVFFGTMI